MSGSEVSSKSSEKDGSYAAMSKPAIFTLITMAAMEWQMDTRLGIYRSFKVSYKGIETKYNRQSS